MTEEPSRARVVAFFDGQNLFYAARDAFRYSFPNVDPKKLALAICAEHGWELVETHFFTGVPAAKDDPIWNGFWAAKLDAMKRTGVKTFSRPLKYSKQTIVKKDGTMEIVRVGREKGIDIRIALDIVRLAHDGTFDIALIFSQDQDLSEVVKELGRIAAMHSTKLRAVTAFPVGNRTKNNRGIVGTDWVPIYKPLFDTCLDTEDYRPEPAPPEGDVVAVPPVVEDEPVAVPVAIAPTPPPQTSPMTVVVVGEKPHRRRRSRSKHTPAGAALASAVSIRPPAPAPLAPPAQVVQEVPPKKAPRRRHRSRSKHAPAPGATTPPTVAPAPVPQPAPAPPPGAKDAAQATPAGRSRRKRGRRGGRGRRKKAPPAT